MDLNIAVRLVEAVRAWLFHHVFVPAILVQAGVSLAIFLFAYVLAGRARVWMDGRFGGDEETETWSARFTTSLRHLTFPLLWLGLQGVAVLAGVEAGVSHGLLDIVLKLLVAWVVIRLGILLIVERALANVLALIVWGVVALDILGLLQPTMDLLDVAAVSIGKDLRISLLMIVEALMTLAILLWAAAFVSNLLVRRLRRVESLRPLCRCCSASF